MTSQLMVQIVITGGAVILALLGGMFARRRSSADVEVTLSAAAREWVQDFQVTAREANERAARAEARIVELQTQMMQIQARIETMERYVRTLEQMVRDLGGTPPSLVLP